MTEPPRVAATYRRLKHDSLGEAEYSVLKVEEGHQRGLVRSVPMSYMLHGRSSVMLDNAAGQASVTASSSGDDPYAHSSAVDTIDYFLSHSWRDRRVSKWLIMLYAVNHTFAMLSGMAVTVLFLVLEGAGVPLPTIHNCVPIPSGQFMPPSNSSPAGHVIELCPGGPFFPICNGIPMGSFVAVYLVLFFVGHKLPCRKAGRLGVFLDKACISQDDPELKAAGIAALGAVVASSKNLLSCASTDYFERLWCNYEVAIFLRIREARNVTLVPLGLPSLFLVGLVLNLVSLYLVDINPTQFINNSSGIDTGNPYWDSFLAMSICGVGFVFYAYVLVGFCLENLVIEHELRNFSVHAAKCFCCQVDHVLEDGTHIMCDRVFVENHIVELYGSVAKFNKSVRQELRETVTRQLGSGAFLFPPQALISFTFLMIVSNAEMAIFMDGYQRKVQIITTACFYSTIYLFMAVLIALLCHLLACVAPPKRVLRLRGIVAVKAAMALICTSAVMMAIAANGFIFDEDTPAAVFWTVCLAPNAFILAAALAFGMAGRHRARNEKAAAAKEEAEEAALKKQRGVVRIPPPVDEEEGETGEEG